MDIAQQNIDDLNTKVTIKVSPSDYEESVKKQLNDYRRKASMPGFRPGKVPFGMIKKMYGNNVLADEVNKLLSDNLYKYINEKKLSVLGNPLPNADEEQNSIDINESKEMTFTYDVGLAPEFDINLTEKDKYTYHKVKVDDELLEKYTKDIAKRYGAVSEVEKSGETDLVNGEFVELNKDGKPKEDGITHTATIAVEYIEDKKVQKQLIGLEKEQTIVVDPHKVSKGTADTAAMLNISKPKAEKLDAKFNFTVKTINRMKPHEVNMELYEKAFGKGNVKDEADFKAKLTAELERALSEDADKFLKKEVADSLIKKLKLELPDEFLKRWLFESNEGKVTKEQIEEEYEEYAKSLRWQLIENQLIEKNELKVEQKEAKARAKELFAAQMKQYGYPEVPDEQLEEAANNILGKQEDAKRIYEDLMDRKMLDFMKDTLTLKDKEVSFDEFVKLATGKPSKGKVLDKLNNLVKF